MAHDRDIYGEIAALVEEEHSLAGKDHAVERRQELEAQLDQCWDLLRQRQARRAAGGNPADAHPRPVREVEEYLQ